MNRHLNIFRAFSLDQSKEHIEDNLSRALILCLKHDVLLCHEFLQTIMLQSHSEGKSDYDYLFANPGDKDSISIDIQVDVTTLDETSFRRIYAIAITSEVLDMANFFKYTYDGSANYRPITDILITINDIAFVFEVKRWGEDCRQQLFDQIYQLTSKQGPNDQSQNGVLQKTDAIIPFSFDWKQIMTLVTAINNFNNLNRSPNSFLKDFIGLVHAFNINWLPITPFSSIPESRNMDAKRQQRLAEALNNLPEPIVLLDYNTRMGIDLDFGWAKEILPWFERDSNDNLTLNVYIWPGNTKGQGWKTFYSPKINNLHHHKTVKINDEEFDVVIENELKFSHFNKFVCEIDFTDDHLIKPLVTTKNFENYSGKYNREDWDRLEHFLDGHFMSDFDWRKICNWEGNFIKTNRNYLTLSIGYQIKTVIPYHYLQQIDKKEDDLEKITGIIVQIYNFYKNLL